MSLSLSLSLSVRITVAASNAARAVRVIRPTHTAARQGGWRDARNPVISVSRHGALPRVIPLLSPLRPTRNRRYPSARDRARERA